MFPRVGDGERLLEGGNALMELDSSGRGCKDVKSEREEGGGSGKKRNAGTHEVRTSRLPLRLASVSVGQMGATPRAMQEPQGALLSHYEKSD